MLVRDEDIQRLRRVHELMEQHVGLRDLHAGGKRPVGADALGLQAAAGVGIGDGRILEAARRDETPQPSDGCGHELHQTHNAVVRVRSGGRRHTHAEGADIDLLRLVAGDNVFYHAARDYHARVRAGLAVGLNDVLPDKAGRVRDAVHVEELQRLTRMDADALIGGAVAVVVIAVHAQEPAVLCIDDDQMAGAVLHILVRHDHIVGNGVDLAGFAHAEVIFLARDGMRTEQEAAVLLMVDFLKHLALAAARCALVHENDLVFIRSLKQRRRGMVGYPALVLADIEQHGEHALLCGGAGIEVIGKDLVQLLAALMHNDLLAGEMRVSEGRSDIDYAARREAGLDVEDALKALHIRQRQREECRVHRADHQAVIAVILSAGLEGQEDYLLRRQPVHSLLAELGELVAVDVLKAGLVGRQIVAYAHAVRIAAAHIVLHEVDHGAVLAAHDLRFFHDAHAWQRVADVVAGAVRRTKAHLLELFLRLRIADAAAFFQCLRQILR